MEITCRKFDYNKELKEQRCLFVDCFPENLGTKVISEEYYKWKFQSFPTENLKSYEYVALKDNEEMVGYYAAIPYRYKIGDEILNVGMVCDVMTSSKYRGVGIFTKLGRFSTEQFGKEGLAFSTGYPIRKTVLPGHIKVGWKVAFDMPLYMHFLSMSSLLKTRGHGWLSYVANPCVSLYNLFLSKRNDKKYIIKIYNNPNSIGGYDDFEKKWRREVPNALVKDAAFMNWRYGAMGKEYVYICAYDKNRLVGMMAASPIVKEGVPSYGVLDFMVLNDDRKCLNNLHNAIKKLARENKKEAIMMMMSRPSCKKYSLLSNAYLRSPFIFHFIVKKYKESLNEDLLYDVNNWHLMFVDSDDL